MISTATSLFSLNRIRNRNSPDTLKNRTIGTIQRKQNARNRPHGNSLFFVCLSKPVLTAFRIEPPKRRAPPQQGLFNPLPV